MADTDTPQDPGRRTGRRQCRHSGVRLPNPKAATTIDKQIGRRLRELREKQDMTLASLARELGISGTQLGKYELGIDRMPSSRLLNAGRVLGGSYGYFLGDPAPQGLGEPEQSAIEPKHCEETRKLVAEFAKIDGLELRRLAIDLVAEIARARRRGRDRRS